MNLFKTIKWSLTLSGMAFTVQSAELAVTIDHIKSDQGMVYVQLFHGEDNYKNNQPHENGVMAAQTGVGEYTFKNLLPGAYVVRLYHDENNNQKMDSNPFGMPSEGYAFSNEAVGNMGPPQYNDMVVVIEADDQKAGTKAKMVYL